MITNEQHLARLRARYANAAGADIFHPAFKAVADQIFNSSDGRKLPFADVATFLDAPYRADGLAQPHPNLAGLDVALIGVPMDLGVTNRSGARFGPRAVRNIERIGPYEHALGLAPLTRLRTADVGDVPMRSRYSLAECHADIEACFAQVVEAGVIPLAVGGDHSVTGSILKAVGRKQPVGMVHIDAHCDTAGTYEGSKFHHGGPFREAVLAGVLDPRRCIQIGIRGGAEYLWEFSFDSGMTVIHAEEFSTVGVQAVIQRAREVVGEGPTYVSFDVDSLDPAYAPGTGTPEVAGLSPREVLSLLRGLQGLQIVGGDVMEVAPQYDATTNTAQVAAQILFEIMCLVALSPTMANR